MATVVLTDDEDDYTDPAGESNAILGLAGNDTIRGLDGADTLDGGTGLDMLIGGTGDDTYVVDALEDVVSESRDAGADLVCTSVSYALPRNVEDLTLLGSADSDGKGNGLDNVLTGNAGQNLLRSGTGDDLLIGGAGDDKLSGSRGDDVLSGGADRDFLSGGEGADQFVFLTVSDIGMKVRRDRITDFQSGVDKIDFTAVDADATIAGDQAFTFIGANAFSKTAGELHAVESFGKTVIEGDVNGDGAADFQIELTGVPPVAAGDFFL